MKIGLYPMVADVIHSGHMIAIEEAKQHCDYLIVALYCKPRHKSPIQSIYERFMQLRSIKWVDEVIAYEDKEDAELMIASLNFDIYFLGEDYRNKDFEGKNIVIDRNKELYFLSRKHPISSTTLKERIVNNAKTD